MQSVFGYGRMLARVLTTGVHNEIQHIANAPSPFSKRSNDLHLITAASGISKYDSTLSLNTKRSCGDDACFLASHQLGDVIGIADGVGGWRSYGVDPSLFAVSLMEACERLVLEGSFQPTLPIRLLEAAYEEVIENKTPLIGSCTACVVCLERNKNRVHTANLGDSGYVVVRHGEVVERSEDQQHYFNTPFQLSVAPPNLRHLTLSDSPASARTSVFDVHDGDVILVASDGLFDNLTDEMILHHVRKMTAKTNENDLRNTAVSLVEHAHTLASDPDYLSPFCQSAAKSGLNLKGGKPDDITVLLSRVSARLPETAL